MLCLCNFKVHKVEPMKSTQTLSCGTEWFILFQWMGCDGKHDGKLLDDFHVCGINLYNHGMGTFNAYTPIFFTFS